MRFGPVAWRHGCGRTHPGRAERSPGGPLLGQFGIGRQSGDLALPQSDPVLREAVEFLRPFHRGSSPQPTIAAAGFGRNGADCAFRTAAFRVLACTEEV